MMRLYMLLVGFLLVSCTDYESIIDNDYDELESLLRTVSTGSMGDARNGKIYKTVKIGNQTWMAENLNYEMSDMHCYESNADNCIKYGRLYTWTAALLACPSGWHLPTNAEWETLIMAVGGESRAGTRLKSNTGWNDNGNGTDAFYFSARPAGAMTLAGFDTGEGNNAFFWSSTEYDKNSAYLMHLRYDHPAASFGSNTKNNGYSVRCLKD